VPNPHPLGYALRRGFEETGSVVKFITVAIVRLLQGRVSLSSVGGPITMYDIAGEAGARGPTTFVRTVALISINVGIINLLPIPVLDGGHLLFFLFEAARRKPLPLRIREVASLAGVVVLVLIMLVAFKNDVERRWDVIVTQVRELMSDARSPGDGPAEERAKT
jgi:regulator of sigma E protease